MSGTVLMMDDTTLQLNLTIDDRNLLKTLKIGVSNTSLWLTMEDGSIRDQSMEPLIGLVNAVSAMEVSFYKVDTTPPVLRMFSLDLDAPGYLWLTFDESVDASTLNTTSITLQTSANNSLTDADTYHTLSRLSSNWYHDRTVQRVSISAEDLNEIKRLYLLGTTVNNTFLSITEGGVRDVFGNPVVEISNADALMATEVPPDETLPKLDFFNLNLTAETLTLTFSETVNASSLSVPALALQSDRSFMTNLTSYYQLTDNSTILGGDPVGQDSTIITISLGITDLNNIKKLTELGTEPSNTFLTLSGAGVRDMSGNPVIPVESNSAHLITFFYGDFIPPTLVRYDLDMDNGILSLTFDETVNASSVQPQEFTLLGEPTNTSSSRLTLTGAWNISTEDSTVIDILITDEDLNEIKRQRGLAASDSSTYLSMTQYAVLDMSMNRVVAVEDNDPLGVFTYTNDTTGPRLTAFDFNMTSDILTLYFSETVSVETSDRTVITFQNEQADEMWTLQYPGALLSNDSTMVLIRVDNRDLNQIKIMTNLSTDVVNTFISITQDLIEDMNNNKVAVIYPNSPLAVLNYTEDTRRPSLVNFDLDMDGTGSLTLTFSESVNVSSLDVTQVTLASDQVNATDTYVIGSLGPGSRSNSSNGPVVVIDLHFDDLDTIKRIQELAVADIRTFLSISDQLVDDMNGNAVIEVGLDNASRVSNYTADRTPPTLDSFTLDLNNGLLLLTFSESVIGETLERFEITLHNSSNGTGSRLMLDDLDVSLLPVNFTLSIQLADSELNELKRITDLATSVNDTWLSVSYGAVEDTNINKLVEIPVNNTQQAAGLIPDISHPKLVNFDVDMDAGTLTLTFDETVLSSSLNVTEITLQNVSTSANLTSYSLTVGTWTEEDSTEITISFSFEDLNRIKQLRDLASDELGDNTFISFTAATTLDMSDNPVIPVQPDNAVAVHNFTEDTTLPELVSYNLDLNSEQLILTFTETVDTLTLMLDQFTIIGSYPEHNYTLTGGNTPSDDWYIIVVQLDIDDVNNIKRDLNVATSDITTNLLLTESAILDMNENELNYSDPQQVLNYTADTRPPILVSFDLDMDSNQLTLVFNETVRVPTLAINQITLQDAEVLSLADANSSEYRSLQFSAPITTDDPVVVIQLHPDDANYIKTYTNLASSANNTFLSLTSSAITDMNNNSVTAVFSLNATQVTKYTPDTTSPVLVSFELDLTEEELRFVFDETVNVTSIDTSVLQFIGLFATDNYTLTGGEIPGTNTTNVTLTLTTADLNEIKKNEDLATAITNSNLSFPSVFLQDMNGNYITPIAPQTARPAAVFIPDKVDPELDSYHLDMDEGLLHLTFSETVRVSTLDPTSFSMQNSNISSNVSYQLMNGSSQSLNNPVVTLVIPKTDLNNIKRNADLATDVEDTFIAMETSGIRDMNNNSVQYIADDNALQAGAFTADTTRPRLVSFDLDMDAGTGILWLTFDETILSSSLDASQITLVNSNTSADVNYTLTNQSKLLDGRLDDPVIPVNLSLFDSNELKKLTELATSVSNTYLLFTNETLTDMRYNEVVEVIDPASISMFTEDTTRPQLQSFIIDMDSNVLTLQFSETVNVASLLVSEIELQDSEESMEDAVQLEPPTASPSDNGPAVDIEISEDDINYLTSLTHLYNSINDSYLTVTNLTIVDMNGNSLIPISDPMAQQAAEYIRDMTSPNLLNFTVDMDNGTIQLFFDETVSLETIDYTKFHLYSDEDGTIDLILTSGNYSEPFTHQPVLFMIRSDIDRTKVTEFLWTNISDTFLYIEKGAIYDWTMQNPVNGITLQADSDPIEEESPQLLSFAVNITSGIITLNFDEPVRPMTLVYQRILLTNAANNETESYRLTGGSSPSPNGRQIEVNITFYDLNAIKALTNLYTSVDTSYLVLESNTIRDMVLNPSAAVYGIQASFHINDTTDPHLVSYDIDMNVGMMILTFSETVDVSTFVLPLFVLQVDSNVSYDQPMSYHRFSNESRVLTSDVLHMLDNRTVVLDISLNDLNEIKRKRIANSINSTWLVIDAGALVDNNLQPVVPLQNGINALRPIIYIDDTRSPVLQYFDLSLNTGTLVLSFSETVDATTLDFTQITLQDSVSNSSEIFTIATSSLYPREVIQVDRCTDSSVSGSGSGALFSGSGMSVLVDFGSNTTNMTAANSSNSTVNIQRPPLSSFNSHIITIHLSHVDLNGIKSLTQLASTQYTTHISITNTTVEDMVGNNVVSIPDDGGQLVQQYEFDVTRPELRSFDFDLDAGNLTITFTETVNVSSLDVTQLTLQNNRDTLGSGFSSYTLHSSPPYPNTSASFTPDRPVIVIQVGHEDLNAIKKIRTLATSDADTYLAWTGSTIRDNAGNPLVPCPSLLARNVARFQPDVTQPELASFDIDLDDGRLILTFTETVKVIDSLDVTQITLQSTADSLGTNLTEYTLTDSSTSMDEDGPVVTIRIGFEDLNQIKYRTELATSVNDTFLSITNLTIVDMRDLVVVEISEESGLQGRIHTPDTTSPVLVNFSLNMDTTTLVLTFNETVDTATLNVSHITLQHSNLSSPDYHSSPYSLTPGLQETHTTSDDSHIVVIHLGPTDRNEIKRRQNLAVSLETTYMYVSPLAVYDMNGNNLTAIEDGKALQAWNYTSDATPPELVSFSIDMDTGSFVLTFGETVNASTLVLTALTFQDYDGDPENNHTLTGGNSSQSDSTMLIVNLTIDDLNSLKRLTICRQVSDCFILHEFAAVEDMMGNFIELRSDGDGLEASTHTPDTTRPELVSYTTNLTAETLTLTFTETVNASSLNFSAFTLQDFFEGTYSYTLTSGTVQEEDSTIIVLTFSLMDLNEIKRITEIYTDRTNSWLTYTEYAITDMSLVPNQVVQRPNTTVQSEGIVTKAFYPDVTNPELWSFDLNLTSHQLVLYFSETVLARTLNISQITLQSDRNRTTDTQRVTLTMGELPLLSHSSSDDFHSLVIDLGQIDTDRIKAMTRLATAHENTFITFNSELLQDMNRNPIVPIPASNAQQVRTFFEDLVPPRLLSFDLNLDSGQIILTFSEAINASSLQVSSISIQSEKNGTDIITWVLTSSEQARDLLGLSVLPTGMSGSGSASPDDDISTITGGLMSGSGSSGSGQAAVSPVIVLDRPHVSSGNCTDMPQVFAPHHSFTESLDLPIIVVQLGFIDLNMLKEQTELATYPGNTYISMTNEAFSDMNQNSLVSVLSDNATGATIVTNDTTPPQLVFFDLNMTSEILSLTFNESVDASTLVVQDLVVQQAEYVSMVSLLSSHQLDGGNGSSADDYIIHVQLADEDLNELKKLIGVATSLDNTFIRFGRGLIKDMSGNRVVEVVNGAAVRVRCFTTDAVRPELDYFHLDMDEGTLHLTFSETVNASSFDVTQITLQDASMNMMNRARQLTTQSSLIETIDSTVLSVRLGAADLNRIKATEMFGLGVADTWISITYLLVMDMNSNVVVPIPDGAAQQATDFTTDQTSPLLVEYHLDFINEKLTLLFNEPINDTMIGYSSITLQDGPNARDSYTLTGGTADNFNNALTIVISFNEPDINYLKMHPSLTTSRSDSFITFESDAFYDTATVPNPVVPLLDAVNASQAKTFVYYPSPLFTSVRPTAGRASGGTLLTVNGTNFGPKAGEVGERQVDILLDFVLGINTTVIEANVSVETISPPADSLIVGVPITLTITVDNSALMINISEAFTYLAPPVITRIFPTAGTQFGGTLVTIYGENFGPSTASGEGPVVSVDIGNKTCSSVTVLSNYTLTCITPSLEPLSSHNVTVTVDMVSNSVPDFFTSLEPPTVTDVTPTSTYKSTPVLVTLTGTQFGPDTASNDSRPLRVFLTSQFRESQCVNVTVTHANSVLTCIVEPNLGPANITVVVDGRESLPSNISFFHYDDAGNFSFENTEFFVSEREMFGNVTVVRHDYPPFASPANISITVYDGTAINGSHYIAANITQWLPYPLNTATFQIAITAINHQPERIRKGASDDVSLNVRLTDVNPLHGQAVIQHSASLLTIKAICQSVTHQCVAEWDLDRIIYYRIDELP